MLPFNKTDIVKMAVSYAVALKATEIAERQVVQFTSFDPDSISVKVGTTVTGHLVAWKLRPLSDKAVDATIRTLKSLKPSKNQ